MDGFNGLPGKVALVTGAGQGLGSAYVRAYSQLGAISVVADLNLDKAESVAEDIRNNGGQAHAFHVDVASEDSVAAMVEEALEQLGRIDILVNNAAIFSTLKMRPFEKIPLKEWRRVLDVNVTGVFLVSRAVVGSMRNNGWGRIVNISSAAWAMGRPNYLHYTSSKAALVGMTRSMARELGADGITVNVLLPGATRTEIERETVSSDQMKAFLAARSIPRVETADDLIGSVMFLSSDASSFVTGQSLTIDGGMTYE